MELTGDLSDFPLSDILQILALSRKTGTLILRGDQGKCGSLVFIRGKLVQAISDTMHCSLGELLLREGAITEKILEETLLCQVQMAVPQPLGALLVDRGHISRDYLQDAIRRQVQASIDEMLRWKRGSFEVKLNAIPVGRGIPYVTIDYIYTSGLNIEELLLEATRSLDEAGHEAHVVSQEAKRPLRDFAEERHLKPVAAMAWLPELEAAMDRSLEPEFAEDQLPEFDIHEDQLPEFDTAKIPGPEQAAVEDLGPELAPVEDLGPELDAVEVRLRELEAAGVRLTELEADEDPSPQPNAGKAHIPELEDAEVHIPELEDAEDYLQELDEILGPGRHSAEPGLPMSLDPTSSLVARSQDPHSLEKDLPSLLQELKQVSFQGEIALLVMRMASELCSRGILFLVRRKNLIGLGQFGMSSDSISPSESMRGAVVPLDQPSILGQAVATGKTQLRQFDATRLGQETTSLSAFAIPMIISGAPRVVIYGDNYPGDRPIGSLQALEILVAHASEIMTSTLRKSTSEKAKP